MSDDILVLSKKAEQAALAAGEALLARDQAWLRVDETMQRDVKLAADRSAESIILDALASTNVGVLSEETGTVGVVQDGRQWIVDPLDGTFNYVRNLPLSCVAIALVEDGNPVLGVIYDFSRSEMFTGIVGRGAWLNGERIQVSSVRQASDGVLATGLPSRRDFSAEALEAFGRSFAQWKKVRMLGSAALSLAYVAAGRVDAYWENSIMPWDIAAGAALVESAGGSVSRDGALDGQPLDVKAANPILLEALNVS